MYYSIYTSYNESMHKKKTGRDFSPRIITEGLFGQLNSKSCSRGAKLKKVRY